MKQRALEYHEGKGQRNSRPGKLEIRATKSLVTQNDLSLAYSPGVAEPCLKIEKDPALAYKYTSKGNLVAVVTNGTAVLGLGDIGPLASKPVMEGKAVLFKKFAEIDGIDLEVNAKSSDEFIDIVASLEPSFGGINLEDISAPDCFVVEKKLKERMDIPVFHDDQHGTAIISGAALINALEITGKKIDQIKVVFCGGGAASISCARFWLSLGVKKENCLMTDRKGVIRADRDDEMNEYKKEFAATGSWHSSMPHTLEEAMVGADVFLGCSVGNVVNIPMLQSMAKNPIVFALANPDPEVSYELAKEARDDLIFATGRSDHPNQINNVLCFPFLFRGALDVQSRNITEGMKIAAATALAQLAKEVVPEEVKNAYGAEDLHYGSQYIIPKPLDPRALVWVASAVAQAAVKEGCARGKYPGGSFSAYKTHLEKLLGKRRSVMRDIRSRVTYKKTKNERQIRLIFPEACHEKVLRAAAQIKDEGIAEPILLGIPEQIKNSIEELHLSSLKECEVIRPSTSDLYREYSTALYEKRCRKGMTRSMASQLMKDNMYFGSMHLVKGRADALLAGVTRSYPETIRPSLHVVGAKGGRKVAGVYMAIWQNTVKFIADATVNVDPSSEELADIAQYTANLAQFLGFAPRVAMISFSNFGSNDHPHARKVSRAVELLRERNPKLMVDGEMQADVAVNPKLLSEQFPFTSLDKNKGANVLVFPELSSANVAYKLLGALGEAEMIGPILVGMDRPVHILPLGASEQDIINMATIAVLDAQRFGIHKVPEGPGRVVDAGKLFDAREW